MIHLDLTGHAVTVEGDGDLDHFITVTTTETEGVASMVARYPDLTMVHWAAPVFREGGLAPLNLGRHVLIEESARARQGTNVMREYDLDEAGLYSLTSGRREMRQARTFFIDMGFTNHETMQVTVLPGSALCPWIVDNDLHNYQPDETFQFNVRVTHLQVGLADGEITRVASDQTGVKFERTTAWARLLEDDPPDSV